MGGPILTSLLFVGLLLLALSRVWGERVCVVLAAIVFAVAFAFSLAAL